jgi:hypothetical protein
LTGGLTKDKPKPVQDGTAEDHTFRITSLSEENHYRRLGRNLHQGPQTSHRRPHGLHAGEFKDRVVIPYYGPTGDLIYWNSRDLTDKAYLRYRGPKKDEVGVGKEDVLWLDVVAEAEDQGVHDGGRVRRDESEFDGFDGGGVWREGREREADRVVETLS